MNSAVPQWSKYSQFLMFLLQVSLEEFLESCRHTSLLTELEDEEELPDAEDDDPNDENDDEVSRN